MTPHLKHLKKLLEPCNQNKTLSYMIVFYFGLHILLDQKLIYIYIYHLIIDQSRSCEGSCDEQAHLRTYQHGRRHRLHRRLRRHLPGRQRLKSNWRPPSEPSWRFSNINPRRVHVPGVLFCLVVQYSIHLVSMSWGCWTTCSFYRSGEQWPEGRVRRHVPFFICRGW